MPAAPSPRNTPPPLPPPPSSPTSLHFPDTLSPPDSPSELPSVSSPENDPASGAALFSPLWTSLLHVANDPITICPAVVASIDTENNPRPLRAIMGDGAEYWLKTDNDVARVKFPARIDRNGQFCRIGPYFNLPSTGLDIAVLQKARAQFELVALDHEDPECPPEAVACSRDMLETLVALYSEVESVRTNENSTRKPSVLPFWRTYEPGRGDHYALIVTTEPLFKSLPAGNRLPPPPKISRGDIGKSRTLLSPSKASSQRARASVSTSNDGQSSASASGTGGLRIRDLPDPHGRYAGLVRSHPEVGDAKVAIPDIRDRNGRLITPAEYDSKIQDGDHVEVEVIMKLWEIPPSLRNNSNGSRIYQLILKSMKLLPYHAYSQANILGVNLLRPSSPLAPSSASRSVRIDKGKGKSSAKGKRKADEDEDEELTGGSPTKKSALTRDDDNDDDFEIVDMETDA